MWQLNIMTFKQMMVILAAAKMSWFLYIYKNVSSSKIVQFGGKDHSLKTWPVRGLCSYEE